jgi:hypothetical protein
MNFEHLTKLGFIRKFRPKRFHKIGPSSPFGGPVPAAPVSSHSASLGILPGSQLAGTFSRSAVRPRTPAEEGGQQQRRRERVAQLDDMKRGNLGGLNDLILLEPPLNEDAVIRALQARFFNQKYHVSEMKTFVLGLFKFTFRKEDFLNLSSIASFRIVTCYLWYSG